MSDSRAFPCPLPSHPYFLDLGLTKRELFAAMAMQGMLANHSEYTPYPEAVEGSVAWADALIAELAKDKR